VGFEEILAVLHRWLGLQIEVGTHGANGSQPVCAVEAQGRLLNGAEMGSESASPGSFLFTLVDDSNAQVAAFRLYENSYAGGGWFDDEEEVLEIRSGVIQILIAPVEP
jgi:hypothetical protein